MNKETSYNKKKKKDKNPNPDAHYEFDLEGKEEAVDTQLVQELKAEKLRLEKLAFKYENIIRVNGLEKSLDKEFSDEEYICVKGIETIKMLIINQIATKDDVNMFDVLYRNLNVIRGIKSSNVKKEKPKSREELLKVINGSKV